MEATTPLVSVIVPCFNVEQTVKRALVSIAQQDHPCLEVIAVDDGSTDGTASILASHGRPVTRVIRLQSNRGVAVARNAGLAVARGEYVAFLDADDEWLPSKISRQVGFISQHPKMTFVSCNARVVDQECRVGIPPFADLLPETPSDAWKALLADTFVWTPTVLARRTSLEQARGFDENLTIAEDQDLWIRLALLGEVAFIDEVLTIVHERPGSLSGTDARLLIDNTLAMVIRHIEAQRHRLTAGEIRGILGRRYTRIGRNAYPHLPFRGAALIVWAILRGYRPIENMAYLLRASPMVRWLKRRYSNEFGRQSSGGPLG